MAGSLASINIRFNTDLKGFSTQMQSATRDIAKFGKDMQNIGAKMSLAFTAPLALLGNESLNLFDTQAKAIAQVEAGLKSTGSVAGYTSKQLQDMASELQNNSLFGDEAILKDVTAQLLTFTNIADDAFARTQQAALDLATRLDGDLKSASIQLGKALNDPKANLSALSRSGIQFSEDQKKVINALQESGQLAKAQTIILDELEKQYGGSAKAAAAAGTGGITQLKNSWGDLLEMFGEIINEALKPLIVYFKDLVASLQGMSAETKKTVLIVAGLVAVIGPLAVIIGTVLTLVPSMIAGFVAIKTAFIALTATMATNPFGLALIAATALITALNIFKPKSQEVVASLKSISGATEIMARVNSEASASISKGVSELKSKIEPLITVLKNNNATLEVRKKAYNDLIKISPDFIGTVDDEFRATEKLSVAYNKLLTNLQNKLKAEAKATTLKKYYDEEAKAIDGSYQAQLKYNELKRQYLALSDYDRRYTTEAKDLYDKLTEATNQYRIAILNEKNAAKNVTEVEKFRRSELEKLLAEQSKYTVNSEKWLSIQEQINLLTNLGVDATTKLAGATGGLNYEMDKLPKAGTIAYFEREISLLKKKQTEDSLTMESYAELGNKIKEFQKQIDAIAVKDIEAVEIEPIKLDPIDSNPFIQSVIKSNQDYLALQVKRNEDAKLLDDEFTTNATTFNEGITAIMQNVGQTFAEGFGEMLGQSIAGGLSIQSVWTLMITALADMAIQVGKLAIGIGISVGGIKKALTSLNPVVAIAAGVALVALGTLAKSALANIAGGGSAPAFANGGVVPGTSLYGDKILARVNSGELILNQKQQSNLWGMMQSGGQGVNVNLEGGFRLAGSDLELVIERAINKNNRKR